MDGKLALLEINCIKEFFEYVVNKGADVAVRKLSLLSVVESEMIFAGKREFALRDASRNIRYVNPDKTGAVQIRDIDGNRYIIDDFDGFDNQSRKKIEAFLV